MQTFPLPETLPIQMFIIYTVLSAVAVFLILLLIWTKTSRKSKGRKYLPRAATAACLIGIGLISYFATIGKANNDMELRNSVVRNYNVNVLTFEKPKLTTMVGKSLRSCEIHSNDQKNYIVQCVNEDGTWSNLDALKEQP